MKNFHLCSKKLYEVIWYRIEVMNQLHHLFIVGIGVQVVMLCPWTELPGLANVKVKVLRCYEFSTKLCSKTMKVLILRASLTFHRS